MVQIPDFNNIQVLFSEGEKSVCRAVRRHDDREVMLKITYDNRSDSSSIIKLKREYSLFTKVNLSYAPKVLGLAEFMGGMAIVMEDGGGVNLNDLIKKQGLPIQTFLKIATQLAAILSELQANSIIHKDIKPENILVNPQTLAIKIIGFDISIQISQETIGILSHRELEGTLRYISPEQTGRMSCALDYRSDFYSLGATFYEMITGSPPFVSTDPIELLHAHLAKMPINPSIARPDIPAVLSAIILKLLEKSPGNRYQSANGLKYDLERCTEVYDKTGTIPFFKIAEYDRSDRFTIPQKLYGRDQEIQLLLQAFDNINKNSKAMVLVSGLSGIGKSSLIHEIHKPILERRGFFVAGKYDQFQRDIPYSGINQAFRSLIRRILAENNDFIEAWRKKIQAALGSNGRVIIDVIPELEWIIGAQAPVIALPPSESQNRFNLVFLQFIQSLTSKEHPIVLFLDDLQWADIPTFKLLELLLGDNQTQQLLVIGAYRSDEIVPTHYLPKAIASIKEKNIKTDEIQLNSLRFDELNQLVADTLLTQPQNTTPLSQLILQKTNGNPFFVNEFLKNLYQEQLITFNYQNGQWEWDIEKIERQDITDNVVVLMHKQLLILDEKARNLCQLAACVGNKFDLKTLATIYKQPINQTAKDLFPAIVAGLILPIGTHYRLAEISNSDEINAQIEYRFSHDRVQQAAYALIAEATKKAVHLKIGQLLLQSYSEEQKNRHIFDLLNQFNQAAPIITDQEKRTALAQMNLNAGKKAKASSAHEPAYTFLKTAADFLPPNSWASHYDLTLEIISEQAECAYLIGNFDLMETQTDTILQNARNILHTTKAYIIKIQTYLSLLKTEKALDVGLEALAKMGIKLTKKANKLAVIAGILKTKLLLRGKTTEFLEDLPQMTAPLQIAQMLILSASASPSYFVSPNLFALIVFKQVEISVKYGNCPDSCSAYSTLGLILNGATNEFAENKKFGDLAMKLANKYNWNTLFAKVYLLYGLFISHWTQAYKSTYHYNISALQKGLETADFLFGAYGAYAHINLAIYAGMPIPELKKLVEMDYLPILQKIKQDLVANWVLMYYQMLFNFSNPAQINLDLNGICTDETSLVQKLEQEKELSGLFNFYLCKLILHYFMGNIDAALEYGKKADALMGSVLATPQIAQILFYYTLTLLRVVESKKSFERLKIMFYVQSNLKKIKLYASSCAENHAAKRYLIEAELARVHKKSPIAWYEKAIELAHENEILQEEALSYELLGRFYEQQKDSKNAKIALLNARNVYLKWGANAKVILLDNEFGHYFQNEAKQTAHLTQNKFIPTTSIDNKEGILFDSAHINFDMESMIKSSVAISSEIILDKLSFKLMEVVIENAGAQRGYLLLATNNWRIMAGGSIDKDTTKIFDIPLINNDLLPESVVNYVVRTQENLVIYDIQKESLFSRDPIVVNQALNSVMCLPILNQGQLIGIIYLENSLNSGVFNEQRVQFLKLLSGQIAVSLQNALLYENLEQKVKERTIEIELEKAKVENALLQLKDAQTQLIHSEKLASLGELTAGIAHEIQNPLNFVNNFSELSVELINDLKEELERPIMDKQYLEELFTDLKQNQEKIFHHGKKASSIVQGMLEHSRTNAATKELVNINNLADEYLRLSYHGIRAKDKSFNADFKTEFDENLPKIHIILQDIGRVFLNLINNAFYAVNEKSKKCQTENYKPTITIVTKQMDKQVLIQIKDNGTGMPDSVKEKVFQPFFTTKPTGSGTGLGLSISYDIITKGHGGTLAVESEEGLSTTFTIALPI